MLGKIVIELVGNLVEFVQTSPRDGREIVVFVMQANIVGQDVEGTIVRVGLGKGDLVGGVGGVGGILGGLLKDVVLGDEVAGAGVQRAGEEGAQDEVGKCAAAGKMNQDIVEGELDDNVEEVDLGEGQVVDEHGPQGVEEDLAGAEEGLAGDGVEEDGLEGRGQVSVKAIDAERLVVGEVVGAERGAVGDADGQVGDDGEEAVGGWRAEGEVVGDFVDGEEEVLVGRGADDVGREQEGPRQNGRRAQEHGAGRLQRHNQQHHVLGEGLGAAQLGHLGVGLDDGHAAGAMRLFGVGPEEVAMELLVGRVVAVGRLVDGLDREAPRRRLARRDCGSRGRGPHCAWLRAAIGRCVLWGGVVEFWREAGVYGGTLDPVQ